MRLPTYDEVSRNEDQLDVYETPSNKSVFVVGPPGSGKTVLALHRSMILVKAGVTVVFITFGRMLRRLSAELATKPIDAMTMHAFIHRHYRKHTQEEPPELRSYIYDWCNMFNKVEQCGITPEAIHIVVDEGQDLPHQFYRYLVRHVAANYSIFADEDQTLTEQRSSLKQIKSQTGLDDPFILRGNHRNNPEVARVAQYFYTGTAPVPTVHRSSLGERPRIILHDSLEHAADRIANWQSTRGGRIGVVVKRNSTGSDLQRLLKQRVNRVRVDMYSFRMKNENTIDILAPGITVLNEKSIKGQEFDTVFVMEIDKFLTRREDIAKRTMYMLCSRARDNLLLMYSGSRMPSSLLSRLPGPELLSRP